jgi:hypothetical protein
MPTYDAVWFTPPAPLARVRLRHDNGVELKGTQLRSVRWVCDVHLASWCAKRTLLPCLR